MFKEDLTMLNKKMTALFLTLLCVCSMALATVAPVVGNPVQVACDGEILEECF